MVRKLLPPGVQSHDRPRQRSQVVRIAGQFEQRITRAVKQKGRQLTVVEVPKDVQVVWDGEDDVVVGTAKQDPRLPFQPHPKPVEGTARTVPIPAGVVADSLDVPVLTLDRVTTQH